MSIQSSINTAIGTVAAVKKAHDIMLQKQANDAMEKQRLAIQQQRLNYQAYVAKTSRKRLNLEIRQMKENIKKEKENGK